MHQFELHDCLINNVNSEIKLVTVDDNGVNDSLDIVQTYDGFGRKQRGFKNCQN